LRPTKYFLERAYANVVVTSIETAVPTTVSLIDTNKARGSDWDEKIYVYASSRGCLGIKKNPRVAISACEANELPIIYINGKIVTAVNAIKKSTLKTSNIRDSVESFRIKAFLSP